jgi:hypothetical protein
MSWSVVSPPRSLDALVAHARVLPYSTAQNVMAAVDWFSALSEEERMQLVHHYLTLPDTENAAQVPA